MAGTRHRDVGVEGWCHTTAQGVYMLARMAVMRVWWERGAEVFFGDLVRRAGAQLGAVWGIASEDYDSADAQDSEGVVQVREGGRMLESKGSGALVVCGANSRGTSPRAACAGRHSTADGPHK